ncbi:amidase-domain-containing protein [Clathrospora elynae]|uniref:Glutamyl-tRNA(Gln) amidotransferase subunit A, mitochondrial n=1 Tax=Clathrospora elynae TaxID=706981 RepID=A0A6A5TB89_9PLEO|nr:amidase-domain-containing protein [Clathrospora elynae]
MSLYKYAKLYALNQSKYAHLNAFNSLVDPSALLARKSVSKAGRSKDDKYDVISGLPMAIKDNICTKELKTTASSGTLKDFTSPYDATVVKLLQDEGAIIVGKTNMDEFGMGSHSTHSHFGPVKLQRYEGEEASAGGSSGGSAVAVASSQCWAALGTDTGGSVRLPAAYTGVVGFKPSYGLLSRWGVIAYANSLDTVGIFGKNAKGVGAIFDKLNVHDPQDPTSLPPSTRKRLGRQRRDMSSLRIGIPLDYNIATLDPTVRQAWIRRLKFLWQCGHTLHPVRLPATQHALSAYYVLAPAEASSNLAKYDGVRFGSRAEGIDGTPDSVLFAKTRGQGFGSEVQRRILLGAFSLSAQAIDNYFIQAQKVRRLVQQDFNNVFATPNPLFDDTTSHSEDMTDKVDILICPTAPSSAPSLSDVKTQDPIHSYMNDVFTVPASLAGLPAISVPSPANPEEGTPEYEHRDSYFHSVGIQIIGQYGDDKLVLDVAKKVEESARTPLTRGGPEVKSWGHSLFNDGTSNERYRYGAQALELGNTITEAKAMHEAAEQEKTNKGAALLQETLGLEHLTEAAELSNKSLEEYIAKFAGVEDPLEAERGFHAYMSKKKDKGLRTAREQEKSKEVTTPFVEHLGHERLH